MKVKINTHGNALPEVHGEWIDLCTAEDVTLDFLEYKIISLGVSIEIPAGYYAHVVPRSSTFGKWGILLAERGNAHSERNAHLPVPPCGESAGHGVCAGGELGQP